jgi:phosphoenolpyruvate synthase/pyruvate phosphate dikinase
MQNIPAQAIAAMATLIAALITAAISFVNLTLNKEQKTSEFRQAWIDGLRDELAKFLAAARAFARAVEVVNTHGAEYQEKTVLRMSDEKVSELRYQAAEMLCKIQLRLNPNEAEHEELLRLLRRAVKEQNAMLRDRSGIEETMAAIELANTYAQPVLKAEWERVKKGELPFRIARNLVAPTIGVLSLVFAALLYFGKFTSCS